MTDVVEVVMWGRRIGAVAWDDDRQLGSFEYDPQFVGSGIEVSPLTMPLGPGIHRFPELAFRTFRGLPGLVADSLPDRFGNLVIDAWLQRQGRARASFSPVEQLAYIGERGMGALQYRPPVGHGAPSDTVDVDTLADLAEAVIRDRLRLSTDLTSDGVAELFRVGTSAGGARAKALIAWNRTTGEIRSGQVDAPAGFEPWLIKFDGVGSGDHDLTDPRGFGRVEFAYHRLATAAGVIMTECRLFDDASGRSHFMTRRFDRSQSGERIHVQTLAGIAHYDYNQPGRYSYEDAFEVARRLEVPRGDIDQLFRRMVFNVVTRNQDDHVKNISFAMNKAGEWRLSPAYDVTWAYNPTGDWTSTHQMTINGRRDGHTIDDLRTVARGAGIAKPDEVLDEVVEVVATWPSVADEVGVPTALIQTIGPTHRMAWER